MRLLYYEKKWLVWCGVQGGQKRKMKTKRGMGLSFAIGMRDCAKGT